MFDIEYKGGNSIIVKSKNTTVVFDPKLSVNGLKDLALNDCVEVLTEDRFKVEGNNVKLIIRYPGEYEFGDFTIYGIPAYRFIDTKDSNPAGVIYRVEVGDVSILVLGNIQPKLTDNQLEEIGMVDIMIAPIGGGGTLDGQNVADLAEQIEPKVIIPIHYEDGKMKYEVPQDGIEKFIEQMSSPYVDAGSKYKD